MSVSNKGFNSNRFHCGSLISTVFQASVREQGPYCLWNIPREFLLQTNRRYFFSYKNKLESCRWYPYSHGRHECDFFRGLKVCYRRSVFKKNCKGVYFLVMTVWLPCFWSMFLSSPCRFLLRLSWGSIGWMVFFTMTSRRTGWGPLNALASSVNFIATWSKNICNICEDCISQHVFCILDVYEVAYQSSYYRGMNRKLATFLRSSPHTYQPWKMSLNPASLSISCHLLQQ